MDGLKKGLFDISIKNMRRTKPRVKLFEPLDPSPNLSVSESLSLKIRSLVERFSLPSLSTENPPDEDELVPLFEDPDANTLLYRFVLERLNQFSAHAVVVQRLFRNFLFDIDLHPPRDVNILLSLQSFCQSVSGDPGLCESANFVLGVLRGLVLRELRQPDSSPRGHELNTETEDVSDEEDEEENVPRRSSSPRRRRRQRPWMNDEDEDEGEGEVPPRPQRRGSTVTSLGPSDEDEDDVMSISPIGSDEDDPYAELDELAPNYPTGTSPPSSPASTTRVRRRLSSATNMGLSFVRRLRKSKAKRQQQRNRRRTGRRGDGDSDSESDLSDGLSDEFEGEDGGVAATSLTGPLTPHFSTAYRWWQRRKIEKKRRDARRTRAMLIAAERNRSRSRRRRTSDDEDDEENSRRVEIVSVSTDRETGPRAFDSAISSPTGVIVHSEMFADHRNSAGGFVGQMLRQKMRARAMGSPSSARQHRRLRAGGGEEFGGEEAAAASRLREATDSLFYVTGSRQRLALSSYFKGRTLSPSDLVPLISPLPINPFPNRVKVWGEPSMIRTSSPPHALRVQYRRSRKRRSTLNWRKLRRSSRRFSSTGSFDQHSGSPGSLRRNRRRESIKSTGASSTHSSNAEGDDEEERHLRLKHIGEIYQHVQNRKQIPVASFSPPRSQPATSPTDASIEPDDLVDSPSTRRKSGLRSLRGGGSSRTSLMKLPESRLTSISRSHFAVLVSRILRPSASAEDAGDSLTHDLSDFVSMLCNIYLAGNVLAYDQILSIFIEMLDSPSPAVRRRVFDVIYNITQKLSLKYVQDDLLEKLNKMSLYMLFKNVDDPKLWRGLFDCVTSFRTPRRWLEQGRSREQYRKGLFSALDVAVLRKCFDAVPTHGILRLQVLELIVHRLYADSEDRRLSLDTLKEAGGIQFILDAYVSSHADAILRLCFLVVFDYVILKMHDDVFHRGPDDWTAVEIQTLAELFLDSGMFVHLAQLFKYLPHSRDFVEEFSLFLFTKLVLFDDGEENDDSVVVVNRPPSSEELVKKTAKLRRIKTCKHLFVPFVRELVRLVVKNMRIESAVRVQARKFDDAVWEILDYLLFGEEDEVNHYAVKDSLCLDKTGEWLLFLLLHHAFVRREKDLESHLLNNFFFKLLARPHRDVENREEIIRRRCMIFLRITERLLLLKSEHEDQMMMLCNTIIAEFMHRVSETDPIELFIKLFYIILDLTTIQVTLPSVEESLDAVLVGEKVDGVLSGSVFVVRSTLGGLSISHIYRLYRTLFKRSTRMTKTSRDDGLRGLIEKFRLILVLLIIQKVEDSDYADIDKVGGVLFFRKLISLEENASILYFSSLFLMRYLSRFARERYQECLRGVVLEVHQGVLDRRALENPFFQVLSILDD